jgi:hypothetical protein
MKTLSQGALDAAVLAAATKGATDQGHLLNVYVTDLGRANISPTRVTVSSSDVDGQTVNMEDGGDSNFLDIVYNMKCTVGLDASVGARLSN